MSSGNSTPSKRTPPPQARTEGTYPTDAAGDDDAGLATIVPTPPTVPRAANPRSLGMYPTEANTEADAALTDKEEGETNKTGEMGETGRSSPPRGASTAAAVATMFDAEGRLFVGSPHHDASSSSSSSTESDQDADPNEEDDEAEAEVLVPLQAESASSGSGKRGHVDANDDVSGEHKDRAVAVGGYDPNNKSSTTTTATTSSSDHIKKNPLTPEGQLEVVDGSDTRRRDATDVVVGENAATDAGTLTVHGAPLLPGVSAVIQNLPNPANAEEYFECVASLDRFRCPLGAELSPIAKEMYGPTTPFNPTLPHTRVLGHVHSDAPNCDHKEPLQLVAGHQFKSPLLLFVLLGIYCGLTTVAFYQLCHWALLLVMWIFFLATVVYGVICSFTNPGIVPARHYTKDIKDRGDIIVVRVPAPNAKKVQERQKEVARLEAEGDTHKGGGGTSSATGSASPTKRRQNATNSGLERYFESQTGKLYPVAPLFSEEEKQYKYKDKKDNKGKDERKEVAVVEFPLGYCWTCGMYKAPRTHHCSKCDVCVDDHDHHCPWTGCCIGRGNYKYFFMCLVTLHIKSVYIVLLSIGISFKWMVDHPRKDFADYLAVTYYLPPIIYAMTYGFGVFFTPLFLGHIYMSGMGFTTSEMLKSKFKDSNYFLGVNPWDAGFIGNYKARLLSRYDRWTDTRYYYSVTIAGILEDKRIDWLLMLPPEERAKVQAIEAKQKADMEAAWMTYNDS